MSSSHFNVEVHKVPSQHVRQYPGATLEDQEDVLYLELKHYRPLSNPNPKAGDVTIIAAHANGFPKELYEPLWDELAQRASRNGFAIRGIWIADVSHQGASGVLNEDKTGNDPSWFDHPRDLLHIINLFRGEMPRPLIGIGHSLGASQLAQLSLIHPRLLSTLVLLDAVAVHTPPPSTRPTPHQASAFRRDFWPSRAEAEDSFRKSKFYQRWDSRVLNLWLQHGLRPTPTPLFPAHVTSTSGSSASSDTGPVTLKTPKHQEVFTFQRPNFHGQDPATGALIINRVTHPDLDPAIDGTSALYRPEPILIMKNLPNLRPSVLYIFGGSSELSTPKLRADKMAETGVGMSGSGGAKEGRVQQVVLEGVGHLVAMEAVVECAENAARWVGSEMRRWREEDATFRKEWGKLGRREKTTLSDEWREKVGGDPRLGAKAGTEKL
ncbi:MAG: hypothetical protein M1837_001366 [Sclerophora amabilis]|nr:MAG: hypothetical protein M1837_001366 [Sclerophora amabilis]